MSSNPGSSAKSPLEAAQKIVAELAGMTSEHQSLAIKFSCETLGLLLPTSASAVATPFNTAQHPISAVIGSGDHSTDIRSFTVMKAPKSDQQFTAIVAYYYQFEAKPDQRKEAIDADTMKEAARLAGRPQVERWNMTLTNAKNAGYLDAAGSGKFKLSSVGENLVAITLPSNSGAVTATKGKRIRKVMKSKTSKKRN